MKMTAQPVSVRTTVFLQMNANGAHSYNLQRLGFERDGFDDLSFLRSKAVEAHFFFNLRAKVETNVQEVLDLDIIEPV